jgi:hypothetical protein
VAEKKKKKTKPSRSKRGLNGNPKRYGNPSKMPKHWVKADKVRVVMNNGKQVLEVWRKPRPKKKKKIRGRR